MIDLLSVVIPAHNEEGSLPDVLDACAAAAPRHAREHEVIVVDDGSTDGTAALLERRAREDPHLRIVSHPRNLGVGPATRHGLAAARGDFILYMDGDGQFDANDLDLLAPHAPDHDLVIGFRNQRADPWYRRMNAGLYNLLLRTLYGLRVTDVNCAFKLMRREPVQRLELHSDSAFMLAELLVQAQRAGLRVHEVPVPHHDRTAGEPSGASPGVVTAAIRDAVIRRLGRRRT